MLIDSRITDMSSIGSKQYTPHSKRIYTSIVDIVDIGLLDPILIWLGITRQHLFEMPGSSFEILIVTQALHAIPVCLQTSLIRTCAYMNQVLRLTTRHNPPLPRLAMRPLPAAVSRLVLEKCMSHPLCADTRSWMVKRAQSHMSEVYESRHHSETHERTSSISPHHFLRK